MNTGTVEAGIVMVTAVSELGSTPSGTPSITARFATTVGGPGSASP